MGEYEEREGSRDGFGMFGGFIMARTNNNKGTIIAMNDVWWRFICASCHIHIST